MEQLCWLRGRLGGGASKFVYTDGLVAKSNYIHDNNGHGLWTDTDNVHTTYENNTIINNRGDGIKHEASYDVVIARNTIKGNGFVPTVWMGNAQIRIQTSSSADIYGNTIEVAPNYGNGIAVTNQKRVEGIYGRCVSSNNRVHDNTITYLGPAGLTGFVDDTGNTSGLGNTFDNNRYIVRDGSTKHWEWMGPKTWTEMKAAGQEQHGTCCK